MPKPKVYFHHNKDNERGFAGNGDKRRQGQEGLGRGGDAGPAEKRGVLPEHVMAYYRQVSATIETGFDEDNPESKVEFLTNVFTGLKSECVSVSRNQTVSRILEVLFAHSSPSHLCPVLCQFCEELTTVVFDAFASHVFQALLQYLPLMCVNKEVEESTEMSTQLKTSIEKLCEFTESHMRDIMTHIYGSHVLRTLLEVLSGVTVKAEVVRSRVSLNQRSKEYAPGPTQDSAILRSFSKEYKDWFEKLSQKVVKLCNYEDHLNDNNYCPVLQTVLLILHKTSPTQYEELATTILEKTCSSSHNEDIPKDDIINRLPQVVQNEVGSYLVELIISLSSGVKFEELYNWLFKGKMLYFSVHPYANYVLQKMLSTVADEKLMQNILDDVSKYIEDILAVNHCGIVTKLAEACRRTGVGQDQFLQVLMSAFHCYEPESKQKKVAPLLLSFQTYDVFCKVKEDTKEEENAILQNVIIHGSLLLQELLQFSKPKLVVSSLLELSPAELLFLSCDKCGSRVVDAVFNSSTVKDKHKDSLIKKQAGLYIKMACSRVGSRCLENVWKTVSMQQRTFIAEDLCKHQERLEGDMTGRFIYRNFALYQFMNRRKEWKDIQGASSRKQQMLQNILEGKQPSKKKVKKRWMDPDNKTIYEDGVTPDGDEESQANLLPIKKKIGKDKKSSTADSSEDPSVPHSCEEVTDKSKTEKMSDSADISENVTEAASDNSKKKRKSEKRRARGLDASIEESCENESPKKEKRKRNVEDEEKLVVSKKKQKRNRLSDTSTVDEDEIVRHTKSKKKKKSKLSVGVNDESKIKRDRLVENEPGAPLDINKKKVKSKKDKTVQLAKLKQHKKSKMDSDECS